MIDDAALDRLIKGNARYVANATRPADHTSTRAALAKGDAAGVSVTGTWRRRIPGIRGYPGDVRHHLHSRRRRRVSLRKTAADTRCAADPRQDAHQPGAPAAAAASAEDRAW